MKLAEASVVGSLFGEHPVLLLDDVLSELDDERQTYLLTRMGEHQTIVTTCDTAAFARTNGKIVMVKAGTVTEGEQGMYFHAGQDFVLNTRDVIGVFDLDTAGASRRTEEYFRSAEDNGAVVDLCAPGSLPKSFLVTDFPDETIYISQLSPVALKKRAEKAELK